MDKIKKVLSPGSSKDDEVLYGSAEDRRKENLSHTEQQTPAKLYPVEGAAGKTDSGGVLRQITNPDGNKYDETRYGATATSDPDPNKLHTDPHSTKDHTVLNQVLNPGGECLEFGDDETFAHASQGTSTTSKSLARRRPQQSMLEKVQKKQVAWTQTRG